MISREASLLLFKRVGIRSRGAVEGLEAGEYRSAFRGQGVEFKGVRPYQWGDDLRQMDWNVTARMGSPYVKELIEERELTQIVVLDKSRSMDFGTRGRVKSNLASEVASFLAFLAISHRDRFGLLTYGEKKLSFFPPAKGEKHVLSILRNADEAAGFPKGRSSVEESLLFLSRILKRKSHLFILSDFLDPIPEKAIGLLAARHEIFSFVMSDPVEWELPEAGSLLLRDAEKGDTLLVSTGSEKIRSRYKFARRDFYDKLKKKFTRIGIRSAFFSTDAPAAYPLLDFLRRLACSR